MVGELSGVRAASPFATIAEAVELEFTDVRQVGPDLRFTAVPRIKED